MPRGDNSKGLWILSKHSFSHLNLNWSSQNLPPKKRANKGNIAKQSKSSWLHYTTVTIKACYTFQPNHWVHLPSKLCNVPYICSEEFLSFLRKRERNNNLLSEYCRPRPKGWYKFTIKSNLFRTNNW